MSISSTPFPHHSVTYMSPCCSSPDQAAYVLLGENHSSRADRARNTALMESLLKPNSVLLVEGVRSMTELKGEPLEDFVLDFRISSKAQESLVLYGWDSLSHREQSESSFFKRYKQKFLCALGPEGSSTIFIEEERPKPTEKQAAPSIADSLALGTGQK